MSTNRNINSSDIFQVLSIDALLQIPRKHPIYLHQEQIESINLLNENVYSEIYQQSSDNLFGCCQQPAQMFVSTDKTYETQRQVPGLLELTSHKQSGFQTEILNSTYQKSLPFRESLQITQLSQQKSAFRGTMFVQHDEFPHQFVCKSQNDEEQVPMIVSNRKSSKNLTKNMAKLLLKWIWVNRGKLKHSLQCSRSQWDKFTFKIREWKRMNNLTRKFLSGKWHQSTEESRMFRILSARFFRTSCLTALLRSNIEDKKIHISKIPRFLEAVSNPCGLDSLT